MASLDARSLPLDETSSARLESRGLRMELIDTSDAARFGAWLRADNRGFYEGAIDDTAMPAIQEALGYRRSTAVVDPSAPDPTAPVATVSSWVADLTVSEGRSLDAWAISAVTVSPTHSGRGIARAMLEGELRTASAAGIPLATLTVSEATLYGRYGFGPAAMTADWTIRRARAKWTGPVPSGRIDVLTPVEWRERIEALHSRVRRQEPGHIDAWGRRWDQLAGLTNEEPEKARQLLAAGYTDEQGELRGLMIYRVDHRGGDYSQHRLTIDMLTTETDDAAAALWRLAVTMPLVDEIQAPMRRLDEPVRWQIADYRAVTLEPRDNLWLRILDVPAVLTSRRYDTNGSVTLRVTDPLGYAEGTWQLDVDAAGEASVTPVDPADDATSSQTRIELGIGELSSVFLGGVSVDTLARAGRIEGSVEAVRQADAVFRSAAEPWLPFWF